MRLTAHSVGYSTIGQSNPFESMSGGYRYNKDPDWTPGDPRYREDTGGAQAVTPERARRLEEFAGYRDEGLSIAEAGLRLDPPVKDKTAYRFERESKAFRKAAP